MLFWIGMLKSSAFLQMEPIMTIYFLQISKFTMWAPNQRLLAFVIVYFEVVVENCSDSQLSLP